jgi:hypothetical protein
MTRSAPKPFSAGDFPQIRAEATRATTLAGRGWSFRPQPVLIARGLALYRYADLSKVPASRRAMAARAQLHAWAPFPETGSALLWFSQGVGIFAWDAARARTRLADLPSMQRAWHSLVPETAYVAAPAGGSGARLIRGLEGVEGQIWRDGYLLASRAWPQLPDDAEWINFLRGAGVAAQDLGNASAALVEPTPWNAEPICRVSSADALIDQEAFLERAAIYLGSLVLMLATAVIFRDYADIAWRSSDLKAELAQHEKTADANRDARDRALAARQQVQVLTDALSHTNALDIIDHLLAHLPQSGTEIQDLTFDGSELRVVLKAPAGISRAAIVRDLEQGGILTDVREARDSPAGTLALVMNLRPPGPAVLPAKSS